MFPRLSLRRLLAAVSCSLIVTAAPATPPEALRDAYLQWRGGDAFRGLHGRHYRGDFRFSTMDGTFEAWEDAAGRSRIDIRLGAVTVSNRVNGETGFSVTPGGQVEVLSAPDCERRLQSMLVSYAGVLEGARGASLSALPAEKTGDEVLEGFRVAFPNGDVCDFYLRPDGELVRSREVTNGEESRTTFGDWRMVDGVRLPGLVESVSAADGQRTRIKTVDTQINPEFDAALFAKPEVVSRLRFHDGASDSGTIPFELFDDKRLFLDGTIGGKAVTLLLDSGASVTVIDSAFARSVGIEPTGRLDIRGTGGTENTPIASDVEITVGRMTLRTGMVVLMDLGGIAKLSDHPMHVVLGKEVLNQTVTDIDFAARTIDFRDPASFIPPEGMVRVPLTVADGNRTVPVNVEGHGPINADFDLGNGGALLLYPASVTRWGLLADRPVAQVLGGGIGGLHTENLFTVKTLEIGGHTLRDLPGVAPVDAEGMAVYASETVQGNVGMPVWSRFHLIMDFGRNQIFLSATPESLARPFPKNRSGLTTVREGDALKVLFVDPAFPEPVCATGAEIVAIDGVPVTAIASKIAWTQQPAGTVVKLTFRDGHEAGLTLKNYY